MTLYTMFDTNKRRGSYQREAPHCRTLMYEVHRIAGGSFLLQVLQTFITWLYGFVRTIEIDWSYEGLPQPKMHISKFEVDTARWHDCQCRPMSVPHEARGVIESSGCTGGGHAESAMRSHCECQWSNITNSC